MPATTTADKAALLGRLHTDPEILVVTNVWDVVTATLAADLPGTKALATASHSIAATFGYRDGENIPLDLMIDFCGRIAAAVEIPVSADLEGGYDDAGETVRRAIGVGIVGANIEDQMRPLPDAVASVASVVAAAEAEGVPFVLNARTDAFLKGAADPLQEALTRGRAFLDAGASCVFVPAKLDIASATTLADAFGPGRLSVIGLPGSPSVEEYAAAGVARISFGPNTQRVALGAFVDLATSLLAGGALPEDVRPLN
jgi:2-methylisocitrate lyase-like PEP mutase family enzyme